MKRVRYLVYRYVTVAEFFNIYKPRGTEQGGGGQKYIDFPKSAVRIAQWRSFFSGLKASREVKRIRGPRWTVPIFSVGIPQSETQQTMTIYQRRSASVCIAAQHIHARAANRVLSWHPDNGFPEPQDPTDRHQLPTGLAVYLARTYEKEVWAGWFRNRQGFPSPCSNTAAQDLLGAGMLRGGNPGTAGFLIFQDEKLFLDETNRSSPFTTAGTRPPRVVPAQSRRRRQRTDEEIVGRLFDEDEETEMRTRDEVRNITIAVRSRNERAARYLKELYQQCQISGTKYLFRKKDRDLYMEVHHLVPLGSGGADDPRNIIVVSPLIHRMLHYADVSEIDLSAMRKNSDGSATLEIQINGEDYTIRWHPRHAQRVLEQQEVNTG